ncbi:MAG: pseudouridine synthase [Lachnospiraceae bacterium]
MIRLDKYLADMGCGTRQEVKKLIRSGQVSVNGAVVKKPETKVEQTVQEVCLNGEKVGYESFEYYMLNKPAGVISATEDRSCQTVVDLIQEKKRKDLFPVGRLDKDTEGLLLITNDGELAHRLLSPKKHVDKCYFARVSGKVTEDDVRSFENGVNIGRLEQPEITMPGKLEIITSDEISQIHLTIQEGKFHQVKRMFRAVGKEVIYLKRLRMGTLVLDENLNIGEYRPLTKEELEKL